MRKSTIKVNYSTIEAGKNMPIAFLIAGIIKTLFRTVRKDEQGFYVSIKGAKQYISKTEQPLKGVSTIVTTGTLAINTPQPAKAEQPAQPAKKAIKAKQPAKKAIEPIEEESLTMGESFNRPVPMNILETFGGQIFKTINTLVDKAVNGTTYTNTAGKEVTTTRSKHLTFEMYTDGMNALGKASNMVELQSTMLIYFLADTAKKIIWKHLEYGNGYKKKELRDTIILENAFSYQNAPSSTNKITDYEVDDIFNTLVMKSFEKEFNPEMFDNDYFHITTLFFQISNITRKAIRDLKFQTRVSIDKHMMFIEDNGFKSTEEEVMELVQEMDIFNEEEMNIIELRVNGFKKNEIDKKVGQRTDRKFKSIEKKYKAVAGE